MPGAIKYRGIVSRSSVDYGGGCRHNYGETLERIDGIIERVGKAHYLEGPPTEDELAAQLPDILPPSLHSSYMKHKVSGNILTIYVTDSVSRQELSLRAPEICKLLNARLGRNAIGAIKARLKR